MISWWLGKNAEGSRDDPEIDAPETPAPVFAARALKSAIFGTPVVHGDDTICEEAAENDIMPRRDSEVVQSRSISPSKLTGILLTPGTATARRKTVSFGTEVLEKHEKNGTESAPRNCPGKFPSPWSARDNLSRKASRKTSLTKSLEQARDSQTRSTKAPTSSQQQSLTVMEIDAESEQPLPSNPEFAKGSKSQNINLNSMEEILTHTEVDGDITVDLNEPRSHSGRYWKSEYENYHEEARNQMKKLVKYKQLAKTFAKMKDTQAIELAEQLKEEQRRVVSMEDKISKLSVQIGVTGLNGMDEQAPELISELAKRTALAVQYRGEVEEFRAALESNWMAKEINIPRAGETKDSAAEAERTREEMQKLRDSLAATGKANQNLHEENRRLGQELEILDHQHQKHMRKCDKRQQLLEEARQKKEDAYQKLQEEYEQLKESAKSQRRDAQHLLKQRHEQVVGLKKELAAKRGVESTIEELQRTLQNKVNEHEQNIAEFQKQIAQLKQSVPQNQTNQPEQVKHLQGRREDAMRLQRARPRSIAESSPFRESLIPIPSHLTTRNSAAAASAITFSQPGHKSASSQRRLSEAALTDVTNNASFESPPRRPPGPVQHTPYATRNFDASIGSPSITFPSPEPSSFQIKDHQRKHHSSPRPSMVYIASNPPKPTNLKSRQSEEAVERRAASTQSSRLSNMDGSKTGNLLPPDRTAAAKGRLELKLAEMKNGQAGGVGKENVRTRVA